MRTARLHEFQRVFRDQKLSGKYFMSKQPALSVFMTECPCSLNLISGKGSEEAVREKGQESYLKRKYKIVDAFPVRILVTLRGF